MKKWKSKEILQIEQYIKLKNLNTTTQTLNVVQIIRFPRKTKKLVYEFGKYYSGKIASVKRLEDLPYGQYHFEYLSCAQDLIIGTWIQMDNDNFVFERFGKDFQSIARFDRDTGMLLYETWPGL